MLVGLNVCRARAMIGQTSGWVPGRCPVHHLPRARALSSLPSSGRRFFFSHQRLFSRFRFCVRLDLNNSTHAVLSFLQTLIFCSGHIPRRRSLLRSWHFVRYRLEKPTRRTSYKNLAETNEERRRIEKCLSLFSEQQGLFGL